MEEQGKYFKTKTGYCHIFDDKIVLSNEKNLTELPKNEKNSIYIVLIGNLLVSVILFLGSFSSFQKERLLSSILIGLLGVYFLIGTIISFKNSNTPVINRKQIKKVDFKKAIPYITRSRFIVFFTDLKGRTKKRLILLPGSFNNGTLETNKALEIMKGENYLNN